MVSRTRLQNGDASYSYKMSGWAGRGAVWRMGDVSRMRRGPSLRKYLFVFVASDSSKKKVSMLHPRTKTDVARRTARAAEDLRTDGRSEDRVSVSGLGSGMIKSSGTVTFGVVLRLVGGAVVAVEGLILLKRSSKNPMANALLVDLLDRLPRANDWWC